MLLYIEMFSYNNMADGCVKQTAKSYCKGVWGIFANPLLIVNYLDQIHI